MINNTVTNAANISVFELIDNNYSIGGGAASISGTVVVASKGPIGQVLQLNADNWQDVLGKPLPMSAGLGAEGLRHLAEAAEDASYLQVVRCVAADFKFPSLAFMADGTVVPGSHGPGTKIAPGEDALFTIYIKDGDPSLNRSIAIEDSSVEESLFTIKLYGKSEANEDVELESHTVSLDEEARDDMGAPIFVESLLESRSSRLGVVVGEAGVEDLQDFASADFEGGTNGGHPDVEDFKKAWNLLASPSVNLTNIFQAGDYDPVIIAHASAIAKGRYIQHFYDAPPYMSHKEAIQWAADAAIQNRQSVLIWGSFTATDPWYGGKALWGFSGAAAAARGRCNAIFSGAVPGVYYTIAGTKRGIVNRRGVKPFFPEDELNKLDLYDARINPILPADNGVGIYIGDALSCHFKQNYERFEWISSLDNHITHLFVEGAANAKFEPDGITLEILTNLMEDIFDPLVTAGAVVVPRNPDEDGEAPYKFRITQKEIDLWMVEWAYCPVGAARRIAGQPILLK